MPTGRAVAFVDLQELNEAEYLEVEARACVRLRALRRARVCAVRHGVPESRGLLESQQAFR